MADAIPFKNNLESRDVLSAIKSIIKAKRTIKKLGLEHPDSFENIDLFRRCLLPIHNHYCIVEHGFLERLIKLPKKYNLQHRVKIPLQLATSFFESPIVFQKIGMNLNELIDYHQHKITNENSPPIQKTNFDIEQFCDSSSEPDDFDIPLAEIKQVVLEEYAIEKQVINTKVVEPEIRLPSIFTKVEYSSALKYFQLNAIRNGIINAPSDSVLLREYSHFSISNDKLFIHSLTPNSTVPTIKCYLQFQIPNLFSHEGAKLRMITTNAHFPIFIGSSLTLSNSVNDYGNVYIIDCNTNKVTLPKSHIFAETRYTSGVNIVHTFNDNAVSIGQDGSIEMYSFENNEIQFISPLLEEKSKFFDRHTDLHAYSTCTPQALELAVACSDPEYNEKGIYIIRINNDNEIIYDQVRSSNTKGYKISAIEFGKGSCKKFFYATYTPYTSDKSLHFLRRWDKLSASHYTQVDFNLGPESEICTLKMSPKGTYIALGTVNAINNKTSLKSVSIGNASEWIGYLVDPLTLTILQTYSVDQHDNNFINFDPNEQFILFSNSADKIRIYSVLDSKVPLMEIVHVPMLVKPPQDRPYSFKQLIRKLGPRSLTWMEMGDLYDTDDALISYSGVCQNTVHFITDLIFCTPSVGGVYFYDLKTSEMIYHIEHELPINSLYVDELYLAFTDVLKTFYCYSFKDLNMNSDFKIDRY